MPKFTNTPQSRGSIEPSLDNLNAIENKNLTQSVKSNENYSSFHHKELEKSLRDSYTSREPYRESYKEPFKDSAKDFYKGSYKENIRENYSGRFNSDQINQYYQSPRHFHQSNQVIQHNQTNHMLGTSNIMNKSFSGPLSETDSGHDYKKEYERLLSKVEEQEKQLV